MKRYLTHGDVLIGVHEMARQILAVFPTGRPIVMYPVPRGGIPVAYLLLGKLPNSAITTDIAMADIIIDDIVDSGATRERFLGRSFACLVNKKNDGMGISGMVLPHGSWVVFPWEDHGDRDSSADDIVVRLLQFVGEDPARGGLKETPRRVLKAWEHWTAGYSKDPKAILKVFEDGAENCDEMVVVRNIPFYSHCEHHLAPFFGTADIAYIPNGKIVGLSKLSRLVGIFAQRLQVQERLTNQIADALVEGLSPLGVGVVIKARHLCMESRGICQQGHHTITSAVRGVMKEQAATRAEFLSLVK